MLLTGQLREVPPPLPLCEVAEGAVAEVAATRHRAGLPAEVDREGELAAPGPAAAAVAAVAPVVGKDTAVVPAAAVVVVAADAAAVVADASGAADADVVGMAGVPSPQPPQPLLLPALEGPSARGSRLLAPGRSQPGRPSDPQPADSALSAAPVFVCVVAGGVQRYEESDGIAHRNGRPAGNGEGGGRRGREGVSQDSTTLWPGIYI